MLENGQGVPVSLREAAFHYRLAALANNKEALIKLCDIYTTRPGFAQNHERALYWLGELARRRHMGAIVAIGDTLIRKGDYSEAFKYFKPGIESGQPDYLRGCAYERLARLYRDGLGTKANPKRAAEYQKKALELGNRNALYTEACALLAAKNTAAGIEMLKRSCAAGLNSAIFKLGTLSRDGVGMPADQKTGYELIRRGALAGDVDAMIVMAESTLHPGPHTPSLEEAIRFADMAEECNDPRAAPLRERLAALQANRDATAPAETSTARPL
jgi:TPR repeat protein